MCGAWIYAHRTEHQETCIELSNRHWHYMSEGCAQAPQDCPLARMKRAGPQDASG